MSLIIGYVGGLVTGIVFRKPIGAAVEESLKWVQQKMKET